MTPLLRRHNHAPRETEAECMGGLEGGRPVGRGAYKVDGGGEPSGEGAAATQRGCL